MNELNITQVSFRRKFNLGNYETLDIELTATVGPDQDTQTILKALDKETIKYRKYREN